MKNAIILLSILIVGGCYSKEPVKTTLKGEALPEFSLLMTDSSTYFNTASLPTGKPVVFFFLGPHCPYSRAQMETIIDKISSFKNIEFVLLTIRSFNDMKEFYKNYKLHQYKNIKMGLDYTNFFPNHFKVYAVPYLVIFGNDGKLREAFSGQTPASQIKNVAES